MAGSVAGAGGDRIIKLWAEGGLQVRGNALPDANNTYTLGTSALRWREIWTNAATINSSDARLKTNIQSSGYGLKEVMQMQPVQYNWKANPAADRQIGFLAQDILKAGARSGCSASQRRPTWHEIYRVDTGACKSYTGTAKKDRRAGEANKAENK
ncbi:MAG: tail fiber domain-containing protein [Bacteroidia bacterium]|nr:tail fiber domain-containing protein [Bacteroidia bacterium]